MAAPLTSFSFVVRLGRGGGAGMRKRGKPPPVRREAISHTMVASTSSGSN